MFRAVVCEGCGAKFRADRDRCPRCRRVIARVDPAAAAVSSRRLSGAAGVVMGVFLLAVSLLWWRQDSAEPPVSRAPSRPAATPPPRATATAPPRSNPGPGAAFLDPSGAATIAYHAGDYGTALSRFEEAVQKNPNDAESLSNLAQVLIKLARTEEAIPHLERATRLNPDRWAYRFNLARALGLLGRWEESIASYEQAQRLFPDDYVTTFNLAMTLHKSGRDSAAVDQYERAIELNPDDSSFRIALANSYERLRMPAEAIAAYSEFLRLSPSGTEAEQVRARIAQLTGSPAPMSAGSRPSSND